MSIALLIETQSEVRRLLIAGGELAAGDFRLLKLLPQLKKAGEGAPVFARMADAMQRAAEPGGEDRLDHLLELANLVNAVLYTQGQTGTAGEWKEMASANLSMGTPVPYRRLEPVIEALIGKGQGRTEIIREAFAEGVFRDLRLINPLISALDDSYAEIAETAADILESLGEEMAPVVKNSLDYGGGKGHGRRVELVSRLRGGREKEFYLEAIEKGSAEVKASAVRALKDLPECVPMLLDLSRDRKKEVREASLLSLAHLGTEEAVKKLSDLFHSKERGLAVPPIKVSKSPEITGMLLEEAEKVLEIVLRSEKGFALFARKADPPDNEVLESFGTVLDCLKGKKDGRALDFLKKCLSHAGHLRQFRSHPDGGGSGTLDGLVAEDIMAYGTPEAFELLDSIRAKYGNSLTGYSFEAAVLAKEPAYVFHHYSGYLKEGRKSFEGREVLEIMERYTDFQEPYRFTDPYASGSSYYSGWKREKKNVLWDDRWVKVLAGIDETGMVCRLASTKTAWCAEYLLQKLEAGKDFSSGMGKDIVRGLLQAGYPNTPEVCADLIGYNFKKSGYSSTYYFNDFARVLRLLPKRSAGLMEDLAKSFDNASAAKLYEVAYYLSNKE